MASFTGTAQTITWSPEFGIDPSSTTINVPSDATMALLFWSYEESSVGVGLASATLDGNSPDEVQEVAITATNTRTSGVAIWVNPTTGASVSLDVAWDDSPNDSPLSAVCFVKGVDLTGVRYKNAINGNGTDALQLVADSATDDIVIAWDCRNNATAPNLPGSHTNIITHSRGGNAGRLSYVTSPGASSTTVDAQDEAESALVVVSIKNAGATYYVVNDSYQTPEATELLVGPSATSGGTGPEPPPPEPEEPPTTNIEAMSATHVRPVVFVKLDFDSDSPPVTTYLHSGIGTITWGSADWMGVGDFGDISPIESASDLTPHGLQLGLSGLDADLMDEVLNQDYWQRPVTIYWGWLNESGELVDDPDAMFVGVVESATIQAGEQNAILLQCEDEMSTLDERNGLLFNDQSQQRLYSGDLGFQYLPQVQRVTLPWAVKGAVLSYGTGPGAHGDSNPLTPIPGWDHGLPSDDTLA